MLTRDQIAREMQNRRGTWPALLAVYGMILLGMFAAGNAII